MKGVNVNVRYFEDYDEREFITQGRTLGEADIINFAGLTGDWAQMHTNAEYASKGVFGQRVGHGALTFSVSTGLIVRAGVFEEESFVAFYGLENMRFLGPVFIGDTIYCNCRITEKKEKEKTGVVSLNVRTINQRNQDVLIYTMKFAVKKRKEK